MKVDISPNFPPSSSWTIEAPLGSASVGGGISACRRSSRMIIFVSPHWCSGRVRWPAVPTEETGKQHPGDARADHPIEERVGDQRAEPGDRADPAAERIAAAA